MAITRRALFMAVIGGVAIGVSRTDRGRSIVDAIETSVKNGRDRLPISRMLCGGGQQSLTEGPSCPA